MTGQDTLICGIPLVQLAGIITGCRVSGFIKSLKYFSYVIRTLVRWNFVYKS